MTPVFERAKTVHALDSSATVIGNWERTLVRISKSPNYGVLRMFKEDIKWTSHVFLGNKTLFGNSYFIS
jgi:hypothetical protein